MRHGLLLINLGTPKNPTSADVRRYLREFLTDKRVIDLPAPLRYLLVYCFILPFRPQKSARAYQAIWTQEGSPLLYHSQRLVAQLKKQVKSPDKIALGMRYSKPSIQDALNSLKDCDRISILPLYPQYSSAATGSSIEEALSILASQDVIPSISVTHSFYQHPAYVKAQAQTINNHLNNSEHLLFSYHGVPNRQTVKSGCKQTCVGNCMDYVDINSKCYRAQCFQTSLLLAAELKLAPDKYTTAFQSRLGKATWIKPYTVDVLADLAAKGIKKIAVVCPSFVSDCLETLEEIGIRAKLQWQALGGEQFTLIPSMNDDVLWLEAILEIINNGY
ncbi:MAG: ferrochelatase [Legionellales bacterium]